MRTADPYMEHLARLASRTLRPDLLEALREFETAYAAMNSAAGQRQEMSRRQAMIPGRAVRTDAEVRASIAEFEERLVRVSEAMELFLRVEDVHSADSVVQIRKLVGTLRDVERLDRQAMTRT